MLELYFYPDSNTAEFIQAAKAYQRVWSDEGERIVEVIERISGLKFVERAINAVVFEGVSRSHPLALRASYLGNVKKASLIHELCHRLLAGNGVGVHRSVTTADLVDEVELHKELDLILYDVWCALYGEEFAVRQVDVERARRPIYKHAFDWALLHSRQEREQLFRQLPRVAAPLRRDSP